MSVKFVDGVHPSLYIVSQTSIFGYPKIIYLACSPEWATVFNSRRVSLSYVYVGVLHG